MKEIKIQKSSCNEDIRYTYNPRYNKKYTYMDVLYSPTIECAYKKPSYDKKHAYHILVKQAILNNSDTYGVIGHNLCTFTFAYVKDNIIYIDTPCNRYWAYLGE